MQTDLAEIGIDITPRVLAESQAFLAIFNVKARNPMSALGGGGYGLHRSEQLRRPELRFERDHRTIIVL